MTSDSSIDLFFSEGRNSTVLKETKKKIPLEETDTMGAPWEDGPPPPYCDASPSAPAMVAVPTAVPAAANSMEPMGLAEKLRGLEKAEAEGLLTSSELKAARQRTIDGFVGGNSGGEGPACESAEAGAREPRPEPKPKQGYSTCTGPQIKLVNKGSPDACRLETPLCANSAVRRLVLADGR